MTGPVMHLRDAAKVYPGPPLVVALQPTTLTIDRGEYIAIVGRSGSGKTTLLNVMGLLDAMSSGHYELLGTDVRTMLEATSAAFRARHIGFVFQAFHLLPYRTALENVAIALLYTVPNSRERRAIADRTLCEVGLQHRRLAAPSTLSGGERQRVAIARALTSDPTVLLCDEPTGNLDRQSAADILDLIDDLNDKGTTVVLITHDRAVAARADRVLVMSDGVVT